jgi:hypothetical protein
MVSIEHHGSIVNAVQILASGKHDARIATIGGCCFVDRARNALVKSFRSARDPAIHGVGARDHRRNPPEA